MGRGALTSLSLRSSTSGRSYSTTGIARLCSRLYSNHQLQMLRAAGSRSLRTQFVRAHLPFAHYPHYAVVLPPCQTHEL